MSAVVHTFYSNYSKRRTNPPPAFAYSRAKLKAASNLAASVLRNVPGEERLPARVGSGTLRRVRGFLTDHVRHQTNFHAAILSAVGSRVIRRCILIFA